MMNRPSEAYALTWGDFTADLRRVDFTKASRRTAAGETVTPGLKTKSRRTVRVPVALAAILQDIRKEQWANGTGWNEADPVFLTETGLPFSKDRFSARWDGYRKLLRLAARPTYYSLKTTGNNFLAEAGVTPEARADRMGHSDTRMALSTYRRVSTPRGRPGSRRVRQSFAPGATRSVMRRWFTSWFTAPEELAGTPMFIRLFFSILRTLTL
jgi:integrase